MRSSSPAHGIIITTMTRRHSAGGTERTHVIEAPSLLPHNITLSDQQARRLRDMLTASLGDTTASTGNQVSIDPQARERIASMVLALAHRAPPRWYDDPNDKRCLTCRITNTGTAKELCWHNNTLYPAEIEQRRRSAP